MDTQLLNQLAMAQGEERTVQELSSPTGADTVLISESWRSIQMMSILTGTRSRTPSSCGERPHQRDWRMQVRRSPTYRGILRYVASLEVCDAHVRKVDPALRDNLAKRQYSAHASESLVKLPEYLKQTKWKNPNDSFDGPWQFALPTKLQYFEWLQQNPKEQEAFNTHMALQRMERGPNWFEFYPIEERLLANDSDKSRVFLVDVGGGVGHDLAVFSTKFPQLANRLVLEDQTHVLADVYKQDFKLDSQIHRIAVDLFKSQPIKGAKVYYLRTVLHDWPDKQAKLILKHIHDAMDSDSILLLNENALPEEKVPGFQARVDWLMMSILSGIDRTPEQFKTLLNESGFEVHGVWTPEVKSPGAGSVFEASKN